MAEDDVVDRLLADLTVIEVSRTLAGAYAGKLFADAGASTIMVEGASGHPLRRTWRDDEGWVESPFFAYLSAGKQSAVADLSRLSELARAADILLLESDDTIDATLLEKLARCAVVVAITPWGLGGAWAGQGRPVDAIHHSGRGRLLGHAG